MRATSSSQEDKMKRWTFLMVVSTLLLGCGQVQETSTKDHLPGHAAGGGAQARLMSGAPIMRLLVDPKAPHHTPLSPTADLTYHGGPVLSFANVDAVFWGPNVDTTV